MTIQVREATYKNVPGFSVVGRPSGGGWSLSIFTTTRAGAVRIRDAYKAGGRQAGEAETRAVFADERADT